MIDVDRDQFIKRIAVAILARRRKLEFPAEPSSAIAYAISIADQRCPHGT